MAPSNLGITVDGVDLGGGASVAGRPKLGKIDETFVTKGVHDVARSRAQTAEIALGERRRRLRGLSSCVPTTMALPSATSFREQASIRWGARAPHGLCRPAAQSGIRATKIVPTRIVIGRARSGALSSGLKIMAPATVKLPEDGGYLTITEANVIDYSDMALEFTAPDTFRALFHDDAQG